MKIPDPALELLPALLRPGLLITENQDPFGGLDKSRATIFLPWKYEKIDE
jgi:hypothetical protein